MHIVVQPFQISWAEAFEEAKSQLTEAFKGLDIEFYHIGSTSIPKCWAKPIIDILGVTYDVTQIDAYNETLVKLGYAPLGEYGMRQRRFFKRLLAPSVNLHIFEDTNPEVERHLHFRDYLRKHPEKITEYSQLKVKLAEKFPDDIIQYTLGKEEWIKKQDIAAARELAYPILPKKHVLRKSQWTLQEILKAMENNMHLHMTYFSKYSPSVERIFEPDVTVIRSQISDDTFNYVIFAAFNENNVQERIAHVLSLYKKHHLPFSWWVGETDSPAGLADDLLKTGLTFKEENVGMYLMLGQAEAHFTHSDLEFRRVNAAHALKDFCQVITEIWDFPEAYELIYSPLPPLIYQEGAAFEMHVAYLKGVPIATGILLLDAHVAGIYYVATIPSQRKKGYGRAMLNHLLFQAQNKGYFVSTLQASSQGKALYKSLGFKQCCLFKEFASK